MIPGLPCFAVRNPESRSAFRTVAAVCMALRGTLTRDFCEVGRYPSLPTLFKIHLKVQQATLCGVLYDSMSFQTNLEDGTPALLLIASTGKKVATRVLEVRDGAAAVYLGGVGAVARQNTDCLRVPGCRFCASSRKGQSIKVCGEITAVNNDTEHGYYRVYRGFDMPSLCRCLQLLGFNLGLSRQFWKRGSFGRDSQEADVLSSCPKISHGCLFKL